MWLFRFQFKDFEIISNSLYFSLQALLNYFCFYFSYFWPCLPYEHLLFGAFPAVFIKVSSTLDSKFSISKFIFSILFVCNLTKSSHLIVRNSFSCVSVYNFFSFLFHIIFCSRSSSKQFDVFDLSV